MDIKQEDLIKFWTWCGFEQSKLKYIDGNFQFPQEPLRWIGLPLSLDRIYEFAIPKLQKEGIVIELSSVRYKGFTVKVIQANGYSSLALKIYDSPTEALYNAHNESDRK